MKSDIDELKVQLFLSVFVVVVVVVVLMANEIIGFGFAVVLVGCASDSCGSEVECAYV